MAHEMYLKTELFLTRVYKATILETILDNKNYIALLQQQLLSLVMSTPRNIPCDDNPNYTLPWTEYALDRFNEIMEKLEEAFFLKHRLELFQENIEDVKEDQ